MSLIEQIQNRESFLKQEIENLITKKVVLDAEILVRMEERSALQKIINDADKQED